MDNKNLKQLSREFVPIAEFNEAKEKCKRLELKLEYMSGIMEVLKSDLQVN